MSSNPTTTIIVGALILVALALIVVALVRRNRSATLQRRFGPEYDRVVQQRGRAAAEDELARRESRVKRMHIEELPPGAKRRYVEEWRTVQNRFVDEPKSALANADVLVTNVMRDRGYPMDNFNQQVADLSPDHPGVVDNYRAAHAVAARCERGEVPTEDIRQAMIHYRALFDDLVGSQAQVNDGKRVQ